MPTRTVAEVSFFLSTPGQWVLLEEQVNEGADFNRQLEIPPTTRVSLRHNHMWPFWHHQVDLREGLHNFHFALGWNKYQVRLDSPDPATVRWIL